MKAGVLRRGVASAALACALACALAWAFPLAVRADTLEQALAQAYQNNPTLNSQRAVVRATDETVPQALSGYKPTVRVTGTIGQEYTSTVGKTNNTRSVSVLTPTGGTANVSVSAPGVSYPRNAFGYSPNNVAATLTQNIYNGFQTANGVRLAEANTSAARETLRFAEQTVLLNGATAYMDLLRDGALLELQRRNVEVLQEQLRQTRDRFIVGEVTRTDVAQAETRLAQGRAAVLTAESSYARSRGTYRQVIGVEAGTLVPAAPVDRLTPRRLADAIAIARARHPTVGVAMFGIDAAVLQVKINEGTLYPTAQVVATLNNNWETNLTTQLQAFNAFVQAQISVPLYQGGAEYSRIRQAKETAGQKRLDLETARDAVAYSPNNPVGVVPAWGQLEASKAQILATQAQVAASEIALNGVREEARVGQRTTLDVLNAQQDLVTARTALVTAQHDRVVASYILLAAVGELNLPKLGIMIPLYDPMVHYQQVRDAWIGVRIPDGR